MDTIWLVISPREDVLDRLVMHRGYTRQEAERALNSQMPDREKIPYADVIISNSGDREELREAVTKAWQKSHDVK